MFIATLIAVDRLTMGDVSAALDALDRPVGASWLEEGRCCDILLGDAPGEARQRLEGLIPGVDVVVQRDSDRQRRMIVADMDSTMITVECIDELADYAGVRDQVAAVTERAMRGELDFEAALDARVALLAGVDLATIDRCREERVRLTPGAKALVATMRAHGAYALLVSGGFTRFADAVAAEIGFDAVASNELLIEGGRLSGRVAKPIVDAAGKRAAMEEAAARHRVPMEAVLAIGDGANDIPMLKAAGLGVAYHAKPAVVAAAEARIEANDLSAMLYAQGYPRSEWAEG
jgi:phosphoserine phosphatase